MKPGREGAPPEGRTTDPTGIEVYLEYARENIERSRRLLEEGDLRYAIFSANEGLELCVKAFMLRYGIIDRPITAGHFPYLALVNKMAEITKASVERNPANKNKLEKALGLLPTLEKEFDRMQKRTFQILLWKSSLGIKLADDEEKRIGKFCKTMSDWGEKMIQMQAGSQQPSKQGQDRCAPGEKAEIFEVVSRAAREQSGINDAEFLPLSGDKQIFHSGALYLGQLLAVVELFALLGVITASSAHQQISRYPTQIDGNDSREVYAKHKDDGVKNLLTQIYGTTERLLKHLECGAPLLVQGMVDISADRGRFIRPDKWTSDVHAATS